ncbi:MAG: 7TM-DISM domain-containing protein [Flavobacteriales bacterium]|nr:7TM-DISM domain-containing protein [Flavobacteriales bacterium]
MLVLFLYNIFVFASTRDRNYLYYVLSILAVTCTQLSLQGQGPFNYLPVSGWLTASCRSAFLQSRCIPFGFEFARRFINTKRYAPRMDRCAP